MPLGYSFPVLKSYATKEYQQGIDLPFVKLLHRHSVFIQVTLKTYESILDAYNISQLFFFIVNVFKGLLKHGVVFLRLQN